jgi:spermidine synthase
MYERLLVKNDFKSGENFTNLVENRSGVIAVDPYATVFGGGVYDGRFNTDLVHDSNLLVRAFAVAGFNRRPKDVLMIGLSSGSWAQVIANHPDVESVTIVEINPGYVPLIRQYANVENLLRNPKVNIITDDGRRWLVSHPDRRFDLILMNTSFHWRANATNLLSSEFLALCRAHMKPGGVTYYNTTSSGDVQYTGATVFPYALRFVNFLAVSDSPLTLDKERWSTALAGYQIDGRPVLNLADPAQRKRNEEVLHLADLWDVPNGPLESRASLLRRLQGARVITDDNMGTEWR